MSQAAHTTHKAMDLLKLWWELPRNWWKNQWKRENCGIMVYCSVGPHPINSTLPSPLEMLTGRRPCSSLPQLPSSIGKNMETSRIRQELLREAAQQQHFHRSHGFGAWTTCSLSRKWMETFGEQPLSINKQLSLIPIGLDFQTIPYWEGPDQWSSQGLYLLILSFRLKHNRGTLKEKLTHILLNPSTSWMDSQCCLLHQWWVWPNQQQLIGEAKSVK